MTAWLKKKTYLTITIFYCLIIQVENIIHVIDQKQTMVDDLDWFLWMTKSKEIGQMYFWRHTLKWSFLLVSCEQLLRKKRKVYDHVELEIKGSQVDGVHFGDTSFNWNVYSKKLKIRIIWFTFGSKNEGKTVLFLAIVHTTTPSSILLLMEVFCYLWNKMCLSKLMHWRSSHCQPFKSISELLHFRREIIRLRVLSHAQRQTSWVEWNEDCCIESLMAYWKFVFSFNGVLKINGSFYFSQSNFFSVWMTVDSSSQFCVDFSQQVDDFCFKLVTNSKKATKMVATWRVDLQVKVRVFHWLIPLVWVIEWFGTNKHK